MIPSGIEYARHWGKLQSEMKVTVPAVDGFYLPGEFSAQEAVWIGWPTEPSVWRQAGKPAQKVFLQIISALSEYQKVNVVAMPDLVEDVRQQIEKSVVEPRSVSVHAIASNDCWMRDIGPLFLVNGKGEVRGVDFDFNAWGGIEEGCYSNWDDDAKVARTILQDIVGVERYKCSLILEGGSVSSDGEGTLLTTEECLLNKNRNPQCTKDDIEQQLKLYLGVEKVLWIPRGLYGDM
jgi:agmatine deiminase